MPPPTVHLRRASTENARAIFIDKVSSGDFSFIDDAVLKASWERCSRWHAPNAKIPFETAPRERVLTTVDQHRPLIQRFEHAVSGFSPSLRRGQLHAVLTDADAIILAHHGDCAGLDSRHLRAVTTGTDMSERAIGTAGMNCALHSGRPIQVLGGEHFLMSNAQIQCAASPIFSPTNRLIGAINLSQFYCGSALGFLELAKDIAGHIELGLLNELNGRLLHLGPGGLAAISVGSSGEILGLTQAARAMLGITRSSDEILFFDEVFDRPLGLALAELNKNAVAELNLVSGIVVQVHGARQQVERSDRETVQKRSGTRRGLEWGDEAFEQEFSAARQAVEHGLPVLLRGETGTGKEVLARALHQDGPRASGPFIAINCAALPESLIESELFGYGDGTFTGGRKGGAPGRVEEAQGGTLFLDEIGDMPISLQSRLLRLLDRQEVVRLGSSKVIKLNFQLICATHQNLEEMTVKSTFRSDLLYRINSLTVTLPPLRERADRNRLFRELVYNGCRHEPGIDDDALETMYDQDWPGNVRQVLSTLRRALLFVLPGHPIDGHAIERALGVQGSIARQQREPNCESSVAQISSIRRMETAPHPEICTDHLPQALCDVEDRAILDALKRTNGNVVRSAQILAISRSTLQRRIRSRAALSLALERARGI